MKGAKTMTNEEVIKNMSTKELAEYLFDRGNGSEYCYDICLLHDTGEACDFKCIKHICEWLRKAQEHE